MRSFSPPAPAPTTNSTFPSGFQAGCACDAVNPAASKKNAAAARRGVLVRMSSSRETGLMSRCRVLFGAACRQYNLRRSAEISSRCDRSRGRDGCGRVGGVTIPARPCFVTAISLCVIDCHRRRQEATGGSPATAGEMKSGATFCGSSLLLVKHRPAATSPASPRATRTPPPPRSAWRPRSADRSASAPRAGRRSCRREC